jgi:glc operon protein GlcG
MSSLKSIVAALLVAFATVSSAQTPPTPPPAPPYGPPITYQAAKRAMAAAELEAAKNNWAVAIAIVDSGGQLVMLHRLDNVQHASIRIAQGKARTALAFRRDTKTLEEAIARGGAGLRLLALDDVTPLEGGLLIMADGKIIGAIGVSGVASQQDAQIAQAGADAAK